MRKRIVTAIAVTLVVALMGLTGLTRSIGAQTSPTKATCPDTSKPIITPTATSTVATPSATATTPTDPVALGSSNMTKLAEPGQFNLLHTVLDFNAGVISAPYFFQGQVNLIVIDGSITYCSGSLQHVLVPGDSWTIPPKALFTLANGGTDVARLSLVAFEPLTTPTPSGTAGTPATTQASATVVPTVTGTPSGTAAANTVAYLGVRVTAVDNTGIQVLALLTNSPAGAAGVQVNDIIVAVNGQPISGLLPASAATATVGPNQVAPLVTAFFQLIAQHKPGETLQLTVQRGGQSQTIAVTLGAIAG